MELFRPVLALSPALPAASVTVCPCIRAAMVQTALIFAVVFAAAAAPLVVGDSCAEHSPIPCRIFSTYDTGDNIEASTCHNLCWSAQGDDGYWCIKASTQQCVCFYDNNCGCPARSSVESDCTNPSLMGKNDDPRFVLPNSLVQANKTHDLASGGQNRTDAKGLVV